MMHNARPKFSKELLNVRRIQETVRSFRLYSHRTSRRLSVWQLGFFLKRASWKRGRARRGRPRLVCTAHSASV